MNRKYKEELILIILCLVQFNNIVDFMIMMPLGPQLMRLFDISPQQFGFLVAAYQIASGLSSFLGAFAVDGFDRRTTLIFCYIGFSIGTLLCGLAPNFFLLLLARSVAGMFGGILSTQVLATVADVFPMERRGVAMGKVMSAFALASVLGVPAGLYLSNLFSWHAPFIILALFGVPIVFMMKLYIPSLKGHIGSQRERPIEIMRHVTQDPNQLRALTLGIILVLGQFSLIPFISPYMVGNVGLSESDLPLIYLFGGLANIISLPLIGKSADKWGAKRTFQIGVLLSIIPMLLLTHLGPTSVVFSIFITTVFMVCMGARMVPGMTLITSTVTPQSRGSFMGFNGSLQALAAGSASFISGILVTKKPDGSLDGYHLVGYIAAVTSLLCIIIANRIISKERVQKDLLSPAEHAGG